MESFTIYGPLVVAFSDHAHLFVNLLHEILHNQVYIEQLNIYM